MKEYHKFRYLILAAMMTVGYTSMAQKPPEYLSLDVNDTFISTKWFGPYAFPVPDQLDGRICNTLHAALGMDYTTGHLAGTTETLQDYTKAVTFEFRVPLWTDRVTFSAWGELHEWYRDSPLVRRLRRVHPQYPLNGHDSGNTYLSLDVLALREGKYYPSIAVRFATLLATGDDYEKARHFDCPGYFFDASTGKSFAFGKCSSFRLSGSIGFGCWQASRARQLDVFMYGAKISYSHTYLTLGVEIGGYTGREADGDDPFTIKGRLDLHFGRFSPFFAYAHGFHDWPFDQYRFGLAVDFNILK